MLSNVQTFPGVHPSSYVEGSACLVPGIQRPGSDADHSRHFVPWLRRRTLDCTTTSRVDLCGVVLKYGRINSTKSPVSGAGKVSEPRLMPQAGKVCKFVLV